MLSLLQQTLQVLLLAALLRPVQAIIKFDQATCGVSPGSNPILDDVVNMANAAIVRLLLRLPSAQCHLTYQLDHAELHGQCTVRPTEQRSEGALELLPRHDALRCALRCKALRRPKSMEHRPE